MSDKTSTSEVFSLYGKTYIIGKNGICTKDGKTISKDECNKAFELQCELYPYN